ncbi:MAG: IS630 family transposase, partial [Oscillospiraceae bacterium]
MRKERTDWRGSGLEKQADHLVFLDESSVNIDLTRRYGR